jgi:transposase
VCGPRNRRSRANSVAVRAPQAGIVFDRFHISKHLNEGVDTVRRDEHRELKQRGDERLTGTRDLFLFNAEQLDNDRQQELNALQKQQLRTSRAWAIQDYCRWFRDEPDAIAGREFFNHWNNRAIRSRLESMRKVPRCSNSASTAS